MKQIFVLSLFTLCLCSFTFAQIPPDRSSLLNGEEGTQAKVAQILGYPSPKQALDFSGTLKLTEAQRNQIRDLYDELKTRAQQLGKQIVKIEQELHDALQAGLVNEKAVNDDAQQIGRLRGRLRGAFIAAHLKTKKLMNASQLEMYRKISGTEGKK